MLYLVGLEIEHVEYDFLEISLLNFLAWQRKSLRQSENILKYFYFEHPMVTPYHLEVFKALATRNVRLEYSMIYAWSIQVQIEKTDKLDSEAISKLTSSARSLKSSEYF